jgi:hypothetical protein
MDEEGLVAYLDQGPNKDQRKNEMTAASKLMWAGAMLLSGTATSKHDCI